MTITNSPPTWKNWILEHLDQLVQLTELTHSIDGWSVVPSNIDRAKVGWTELDLEYWEEFDGTLDHGLRLLKIERPDLANDINNILEELAS